MKYLIKLISLASQIVANNRTTPPVQVPSPVQNQTVPDPVKTIYEQIKNIIEQKKSIREEGDVYFESLKNYSMQPEQRELIKYRALDKINNAYDKIHDHAEIAREALQSMDPTQQVGQQAENLNNIIQFFNDIISKIL